MCGLDGNDDSKTMVTVPLIVTKWKKKGVPKSKPYLGVVTTRIAKYYLFPYSICCSIPYR